MLNKCIYSNVINGSVGMEQYKTWGLFLCPPPQPKTDDDAEKQYYQVHL